MDHQAAPQQRPGGARPIASQGPKPETRKVPTPRAVRRIASQLKDPIEAEAACKLVSMSDTSFAVVRTVAALLSKSSAPDTELAKHSAALFQSVEAIMAITGTD